MEKNKGDQKELKDKYLEFQLLNEQLKKLQEQLQLIMQQGIELNNTLGNLNDFKGIKKDTEILVPLTNGIFAKAKILDNENLIVNVGASVALKKTADEVKKLLSDQLDQMNGVQEEMLHNFQKMSERTQSLESELQDLMKTSKE